jgi:hypothetical protein
MRWEERSDFAAKKREREKEDQTTTSKRQRLKSPQVPQQTRITTIRRLPRSSKHGTWNPNSDEHQWYFSTSVGGVQHEPSLKLKVQLNERPGFEGAIRKDGRWRC